jgi:hypothetical protein
MKNLLDVENMPVSVEVLKEIMDQVIDETLQQEDRVGNKVTLCGLSENWYECFSGYPIEGGYYLLFYYNVGPYTKGTPKKIYWREYV